MKKPLIVITGPTACGKTDTAIRLAKELNSPVISADSMQVYKYMDIGTAKPSSLEMDGIKHYMIDEVYPYEEFSVALYTDLAHKYIEKIHSENKIPIVVGGTGFYINALIYGSNFTETEKDYEIRNHYYLLAKEKGNEYVHSLLKDIDICSYEAIHYNNIKRVVRALEYYEQTGKSISSHNQAEKAKEMKYDTSLFVLHMDREALYKRIEKRVDQMMQKGLVAEVEKLISMGCSEKHVSMRAIGYKEIISHIKGEYSLEQAICNIKTNTRHYAKRQLTWFKHQLQANWVYVDDPPNTDIIVKGIIEGMCID